MIEKRPSDQSSIIAAVVDEAKRRNAPMNPTLLARAHWTAADVMGPNKGKQEASTPSSTGAFTIHSDTIDDGVPFTQLAEAIPSAYKKFGELDAEEYGTLGQEKLQTLLRWLLERFHPGGKPLDASNLAKISKEMTEACETSDGKLSFEDFTDWLEVACEDIDRVRRVADWQQHIRFDELECEVIQIHLPESNAPVKAKELLSEEAQAALKRYHERPVWSCCYLG